MDVESGHVVGERYVIEAFVAAGGMGAVYRARDRDTGAQVAVKLQRPSEDPTRTERFAREAEILARLDHPAIVRCIAADPAARYLVMEWIDGDSLEDRLAAGALDVRASLALVRRIAEGLAHAHDRGVVHRDIKPSNLVVAGDAVKILDFGIARDSAAELALTATGLRVGTPGYMAPEQVRGGHHAGPTADVFALGCVLFECLTGRRAFAGDHAMAIHAKIVLDDLPAPSELVSAVPPAVDALVAHLTAKDPRDRPPDGTAVLAELAMAEDGSLIPAGARRDRVSSAEQRLVCVLAVAGPSRIGDDAATVPGGGSAGTADVLRGRSMHVEELQDGSLVATMRGRAAAVDDVMRAAHAALALRDQAPALPIALATGRGLPFNRIPVGALIDRAVELLREAARHAGPGPAPIYLDDATAALVESHLAVGVVPSRRTATEATASLHVLLGPRSPLAAPRTVLGRRLPFVGRARELGALELLLEEAIEDSSARAVLLIGEPGMGKSRLCGELIDRAARRPEPIAVWLADGVVGDDATPYAAFGRCLRRVFGIELDVPAAERRDRLAAQVAAVIAPADRARAVAFLGELAGTPFHAELSPELAAARRDPRLMGSQVVWAWHDLVHAISSRRPVILVIEDVQWLDDASVRLVDATLRLLDRAAALVVGLARPEVDHRFPALWAERGATTLRLGGLPGRALERMVRTARDDLDDARVAALVERAGGNAFFLEELVRAAPAAGAGPVPASVAAVIEQRLEAVSPHARKLARAASVFGHRFAPAGVAALTGLAVDDLDRGLEELVVGEVIIRGRAGACEFRHALVAETVYDSLTAADRTLGHRLAGQFLAGVPGTAPADLARHHEHAGETAPAVAAWTGAAQLARDLGHMPAAVEHARRGLALGATGADRAALECVELDALAWLGKDDEVAARRDVLGRVAPGSALWCDLYGSITASLHRRGEDPFTTGTGEVFLAHATGAAPALELRAAYITMFAALDRRDTARVDAVRELVARYAGTDAALPSEARAWLVGAVALVEQGHSLLDSVHERMLACHLETGDHRRSLASRANVASTLCDVGRLAEAEHHSRVAIAGATRLGLPMIEHQASVSLARAFGRSGRHAEAIAMFDATMAQATSGHVLYVAAVHRARTLLDAGRADAARDAARIAIADAARFPQLAGHAYAVAAAADVRAGAITDDTEAWARQAWAEALPRHAGYGFCGVTLVELLLARGDHGAARALLGELARQLAADAAVLSPAHAAAYLDQVEEHRRIARLAGC